MNASTSTQFDEIAARLADNIQPLAVDLIGAEPSSTTQNEWRFGSKGAVSVKISGSERGQWYDHSAGLGGFTLEM